MADVPGRLNAERGTHARRDRSCGSGGLRAPDEGRRIGFATLVLVSLLTSAASTRVQAWSGQGHRLVALIAAERLTPAALLNETLTLPAPDR